VQIDPLATKLAMTGVQPTQSYGHQAMGASSFQQKAMAKNLKNCTRFGGTASCTTTTIAWKFGMAADPCIRLPLEQLDMWAQVWYSATGADKQETRYSWQKKLTSFLSHGELDVACGPAAGTIAALMEIGWKPVKPDFWVVDKETTVHLNQHPFTRLQIISCATKDLQKKVWAKAARHQHGAGLELGLPSFEAARKAIKYFRKAGLHSAAKALEFILVGFFKDPEETDDRTICFCNRCGRRARATRHHIAYVCEDNSKIEDKLFHKSKNFWKKSKSIWKVVRLPLVQRNSAIQRKPSK
jgi:hypothetical protein